MIDSFVKALCELTDCEVVLEDEVKDGVSTDSGVSDNCKVDYSVICLQLSTVKMVLLEAKTDKTLSQNSVCQLIGYYMAISNEMEGFPPLGVLMTQSTLRTVLFRLNTPLWQPL